MEQSKHLELFFVCTKACQSHPELLLDIWDEGSSKYIFHFCCNGCSVLDLGGCCYVAYSALLHLLSQGIVPQEFWMGFQHRQQNLCQKREALEMSDTKIIEMLNPDRKF